MAIACFVLLTAACASTEPAKQAPARQAASVEPAQKDQSTVEEAEQPASEEQETPKGPIDLGMGDDEDDGDIVIERPKGQKEAEAELADANQKTYEKTCKKLADCDGLEAPDCAGEMTCAEGQCVFVCADEEGEEFSEEDEELEDDAEEDAVEEL